MKCPKCGFVSYSYLDNCKRCGTDLTEHKRKLGIKDEGPIARPAPAPAVEIETARLAERLAEEKAALELERRRLAEEAERLRREAEERARADAEALRRAEEEARRRAEEESRRRAAEEEARRKAEDAARVRREQEEREAREKAERDRREAERMLREREAAAPPVDDGMAAPAAEPAIPESPRTKNMPGAADYLELLAARKRTLPEDAPAPAPKTFDFPPPEEPEDIIPSDGADEEEDAAEDEVAEEELDDEPEAPETETRTAPRSAAPNIKRGGLTVRTFGAAVDLAILGLVVGLFLLIGRSLLTVGGSAPEWSGFLKITGPIYILFLLLAAVYYTFFLGSTGQSPGMMVFGLKVVNRRGDTIGYSLAFLRYVASLFSLLFLGMGIWWIPLDLNKQGWHDKLAQSVVIRV